MATPTTTIDALPPASAVLGSQLIIIQEAGVTKQASIDGLTSYLSTHLAIPLTASDITALSNPMVLGNSVQSQLTDLISRLDAVERNGGGCGGTTGGWLRWTGTQVEYDALPTHRVDTIYSISATGGDPSVPLSAPQTVHALAGDGSATITWLPPAGGTVSVYSIERSLLSSTGFFTQVGTTTSLNFLDTPLTNGTTYYYTVTAHDAGGNSAVSPVVSVVPVTTAPTVPGVPTNVVAIAGASTVTVNWLAPASTGNSPITSYLLQQLVGGSYSTIATLNGSTFSRLVTGLTNGTAYSFRVIAVNAIGNSAPSAVVTATPTVGATVPTAPTAVVATPGVTQVTVTWGAPTSDGGNALTTYVVERSTSPTSGFVIVGTQPMEAPKQFVSTPLTSGTTYYFRVLAQNGVGTSPASAIVSAVPTAGGVVPSDWATAVATGDISIITGWYDTYTGHLSEGFDPANLWGPGQSQAVIINNTWLTNNTAPGKVVFSAGRWTITGLHCLGVDIHVNNVTLSHCWMDRDPTVSAWGVDASPSSNGGTPALGTIIDHCTLQGNFGTGADTDFGDAIQFYSPLTHPVDSFIIRYTDISGYRAGLYTVFGMSCDYNWVHDLYMYGASHNTAGSIRGENTRIYRCLMTDGNSSAVSLYADTTPYREFSVNENILATPNADFTVIFPMRGPNYWNLLYDNSILGTGHVDDALMPSTYGYKRELNGNRMIPALGGVASGMEFFTSTRGNKLLDGTPILFDEGGTPVVGQPCFLKMRYNELGGGFLPQQQTWEFTPSPNSTLLVLVGCVNAGHGTAQTPVVTSQGQFAQPSFTKILESPYTFQVGGDNYGVGLFMYKAETGATTSFQHIIVDPYTTTQGAWFTIWVVELTGMTGLSLAHSSVKGQAAVGFGSFLSTITSNPLSAAATTGRVCLAFAAGAATAAASPSQAYADVAGWNKIGVQKTTFGAGSPFCTGAVYWRKDFTGTTITIPGLGIGTYEAGVLLAEFA